MTAHPTEPLVPADVDLTDFKFMPLEVARLCDSEIMALEDAEAFRAGVVSWCKGWHQVPAASLPSSDTALCKTLGYGRDIKTWTRLRKAGALHGWILCTDGRLYHPVVAEKALEAWLEKLAQRLSSGAGNAKRWGVEFDAQQINEQIATARLFLTRLNPQSKALTKRKPPAIPTGIPTEFPPELPLNDARQSRQVSRRDDERETRQDRKRQGQGLDREKGSTGIDKSSSGGGNARAPAREVPPPPDVDLVGMVLRAVVREAENWFDLPDRTQHDDDPTVAAEWLSLAAEAGLEPKRAVEVIGEEIARQFRKLAERGKEWPRKLRAQIDGDVRGAIARTTAQQRATARPTEDADRAQWRTRLTAFKRTKVWPAPFGPQPFEPGCKAPQDLIAEILGSPDQEPTT